jgi:hypothetical protein
VGGWAIARAALAGLRRRSLDMNVLMTLAAVGAVGIGAYAEGAWVLVLFAVGTTLESFAFDRSRRSIAELMDLAPEQARVRADDGSEHLVPVEEVTVGTRFVVRPGERIPLDGIVVDGASSVDEAPITGESVPVDKQADSTVFAGTLNAQGALTVRTSSSAAESTLARVVALVEEAQSSRAPSERFVDHFAGIYTPLVFAAALAVLMTIDVDRSPAERCAPVKACAALQSARRSDCFAAPITCFRASRPGPGDARCGRRASVREAHSNTPAHARRNESAASRARDSCPSSGAVTRRLASSATAWRRKEWLVAMPSGFSFHARRRRAGRLR